MTRLIVEPNDQYNQTLVDNVHPADWVDPTHHLVVIGGGPIDREPAQAFRGLGSQVTIIQDGPTFLPRAVTGYKILFTIARHALSKTPKPPVTTIPSPAETPSLSVIIPALNEATHIADTIAAAQRVSPVEIIVADGGSSDETVSIATSCGAQVINTKTGRGIQMNRAAEIAGGDILLFLHADTRLPENYAREIYTCLASPDTAGGAFLLHIDHASRGARIIEHGVSIRSRRLSLPFGDQGIFLRRNLFKKLNGFKEIPLMEDYDFMRRLRRFGRIRIVMKPVTTSARRWQQLGLIRTTLINQAMIAGYLLGISTDRLAGWYRPTSQTSSDQRTVTDQHSQKGTP